MSNDIAQQFELITILSWFNEDEFYMQITTIYDTGNQFSWDQKSTSYDNFGFIELVGYVYDNGASSIQLYELGNLYSL